MPDVRGRIGAAKVSPAKGGPAKAGPVKAAVAKAAATPPATKAAAAKAPAKKAAAATPPAKKAAAAAPAKKAAAAKAPAKNAAAAKAPPARKAIAEASAAATPAKKAASRKAPVVGRPDDAVTAAAADLNTTTLTAAELTEIRSRLQRESAEMQLEYERSVSELNALRQQHSDGAGDDQADVGSKTFEREQEQSITANRRLLLIQIEHAIERIDSGAYGVCEDCGRPIPKARLKALPMATLDAECKARAERR